MHFNNIMEYMFLRTLHIYIPFFIFFAFMIIMVYIRFYQILIKDIEKPDKKWNLLSTITNMYKNNIVELHVNDELKLTVLNNHWSHDDVLNANNQIFDLSLNMTMHPYMPPSFRAFQDTYDRTKKFVFPIYESPIMLHSYYEKLLMCQSPLSYLIHKKLQITPIGTRRCNVSKLLNMYMINMTIAFEFGLSPVASMSSKPVNDFKKLLRSFVNMVLQMEPDRVINFINTLMTRILNCRLQLNYDKEKKQPDLLQIFNSIIINDMEAIEIEKELPHLLLSDQSMKVPRCNYLQYLMNFRNNPDFSKHSTTYNTLSTLDTNYYAFLNISTHQEITVSTILFCLIELTVNKRCQKRLQEEIAIHVPILPVASSMTYETIKKLIYLDCCVRETLRKYPTVPYILRKNIEKAPFSKGINQFYVIPIIGYHRDKTLFSDPMSFKPERFLNPAVRNHSHYLPFGHNSRRCPGADMALMNVKLVLMTILSEYDIINCNGYNKKTKDIDFDRNYVHLKPSVDIYFELKPKVL